MIAAFAWLDSSERERRRILDVIDLLKEPGTVDELGLGTVRDTIADILAPGTSTIQTRARYFFFIPWLYLQLERRGSITQVTSAARKLEVELIESLSQAEDTAGTIGIQSRSTLKRLPSTIYWAGLARLGFCLFRGSLDQYHRSLGRGLKQAERDDAGDLTVDSPFTGNWHPHIPEPPKDFPGKAWFSLRKTEARFFQERLRANAPDSLLAYLAAREESVLDVNYPWQYARLNSLPAALRRWIIDGQNYSELMHGAQLLYNLLLAQAANRESLATTYEEQMRGWAERMAARRPIYQAWDREAFWERLANVNQNLRPGVRLFSEAWISRVLSADNLPSLASDDVERKLVADREEQMKGPRARLRNRTQLDLWQGETGIDPLNYRWPVTKRIIEDIVATLHQEEEPKDA